MAPQILAISLFLSVTWGIYLAGTLSLYWKIHAQRPRRRQDVVVALRRFIVALCAWLFVFSFVFRTFCVVIGIGDEIAVQIVFFTLLGTNVVGSLFAIVSLWYD
jgi:hypothetical protein